MPAANNLSRNTLIGLQCFELPRSVDQYRLLDGTIGGEALCNRSVFFIEVYMKRREFLRTSAASSACALGTGLSAAELGGDGTQQETACRITVLRRTLNRDFIQEYRDSAVDYCSRFEDGQEFLVESPWIMPEGFCNWAWADIRTFIHTVHLGRFEKFVACCTDGYRPVFFLIERIDA